ncbi:MAG: DUF1080 domain-containing protein [Verrucomicrobiota bacterium]
MNSPAILLLALTLGALAPVALAQAPAPKAAPAPAANAAAAKPSTDPDAGFVSIFDGKSLANWDGDPKYWRLENGCLVGEITPETIVKRNTFIIWRGGSPADFELKLQYRISDQGNSGINYRSVELTDARWSLAGYQADIDGAAKNKGGVRHTGQNYEERGRTFLARRGEVVRIDPSAKLSVVASLGDTAELAKAIKEGDWNEYHLIARGHVITHILNGKVMSVVIDDDPKNRRADGLLGVQVHVGPPMKVEYRAIRLKTLEK